MPRSLLSVAVAGAAFGAAALAAPAVRAEAFVRVVTGDAALRTGPGVSYRVVERVERGEAFQVVGREGKGFWLRVRLPDGRELYVLGDAVEPLTAGTDSPEAARRAGIFSPPALQTARGGFAMLGGAFDGAGYAELKPALVLAPAIALEPYAGIALQADGRRFLYGLGTTFNFAPDWAIAPFVQLGFGGVHEDPNDEFIRTSRDRFQARAGGGLLISLRLRVSLRLEASNSVLFTNDSHENAQTYIGGLGTYF